MGPQDVLFLVLSSLVAIGITVTVYYARSRSIIYPPGPPGIPLLGNVFDVPTAEPWAAFKKLGEKYGNLVYIRVLSQRSIVLNSYEAIRDLLEQRSQIYSDRPYLPANEILGMSWGTAFLPYGNEWRAHRKIFQQILRSESVDTYYPTLSMKTRQLLNNIKDSPADFEQHFGMFATAVIMAITYDYHPSPRFDPIVKNLKEVDDILNYTMNPKNSVVMGTFPFLMYIPPWLPGATWQRAAHAGKKAGEWWLEAPVQYVKDRMANHQPVAQCIVREILSRIDKKQPDTESAIHDLKATAATSLVAGSETTDSTLRVFVLAMVLYPDVQRRAQDEIRAVVGTQRLPDISDRSSLPYIEAIFRETLRWHPVLPLALPRRLVKDDVYQGYYLPKGITIVPNIWAVAHDEVRYPEPSTFNPSRFFDKQGNLTNDTAMYAFGFGRRICSGRTLAEASVWSAIANLLATFSFEAPLDETGQALKIEPKFTMGLTSHPEHFPVRITLRMEEEQFVRVLRQDD